MAVDRLSQLASTSADLTEMLKQLRAEGLHEELGRDRLLDADSTDDVLDEFLSLAVRDVDDQVLFGLALSLPICVLRRGVGQEALDYCLAQRELSPAERGHVVSRLSKLRGTGETACDHLRRVRGYAGFSTDTLWYYEVLRADSDEIFKHCASEVEDYLTDPCFGARGSRNVDCLGLAIERSRNPEPFIRHWIAWIDNGCFDGSNPSSGSIYGYLDERSGDPKLAAIAEAAHTHVVRLLSSSDRVVETWWHLRGMLERRYGGASQVLAAIRQCGLNLDDRQRQVLRYQMGTLVALAEGSAGGKSLDEWMSLMLKDQGA